MRGGELADLIKKYRKKFTRAGIKKIIYQLFYALNYMHQMDLIHRDIKPANILIPYPEKLDIKVADLGLATYMNGKPVSL